MLKKYKPFLRAGAMDTLSYRFNILIWAVITVFQVACLVFLWLAVYRSSAGGMDAEIHDFTFREMIAYVVLTTVFNYVTFNNDTLWNINNDIRKGTIGNYLIKPISYRGKFAATSFGSLLTMTLLFGIPFYAAALLTLGGLGFLPDLSFPAFFVHLGLFLVAGLFASLLNDVIAYIFGVFCFYDLFPLRHAPAPGLFPGGAARGRELDALRRHEPKPGADPDDEIRPCRVAALPRADGSVDRRAGAFCEAPVLARHPQGHGAGRLICATSISISPASSAA